LNSLSFFACRRWMNVNWQPEREITIIQEFVGYNWLAMKFK